MRSNMGPPEWLMIQRCSPVFRSEGFRCLIEALRPQHQAEEKVYEVRAFFLRVKIERRSRLRGQFIHTGGKILPI